MERANHQIDGSHSLTTDLEFHGMVTGTLTVPTGREVRLHGLVTGDLIIEKGAKALVAGMVNGTVVNHGGDVRIDGMVGAVRDFDQSNPTVVTPNAKIVGVA